MLSAFRLYPDEGQEKILNRQLETCKRLCNVAVQWHIGHYLTMGRGLTYADLANALPKGKGDDRELVEIYSQVLQKVLKRANAAFVNFFEGRTKYLHYKKYISSLTYPEQQYEVWRAGGGKGRR